MVTSLIESADGSLWIGTVGGLFHRRLSGEVSAEPIALRSGVTHVRALARDKDGRLWVGHDEGLLVLGPGAGAARPASSVRQLRSCGTGSSRHRRLHLPARADDACAMNPGDGLVDQRVRALTAGSDGQVRVGMVSGSVATVSGLGDIDGAQLTSVGPAHGLVDDPITTVAEDRGRQRVDRHGCQRCPEDSGPWAGQLLRIRRAEKRLRPVPVRGRRGASHRGFGQSLRHQRIRRPSFREDAGSTFRRACRIPVYSLCCATTWAPGGSGRRQACIDSRPLAASRTWHGHARRPLCRDRDAAKRRVCIRSSRTAGETSG